MIMVRRILNGCVAALVLLAAIIGLPYALWHFLGSPIPDHFPTLADIQTAESNPVTSTALLRMLGAACWILWALVVAHTVRAAVTTIRSAVRPIVMAGGPLRATVNLLIGAIVIALSSSRTAPAVAASTTSGASATGTENYTVSPSAAATIEQPSNTTRTITVAASINGVHDSLWRIAERTLGNGSRWPEIFALNRNHIQPSGSRFTNPNVIYPGEQFLLPTGENTSEGTNNAPTSKTTTPPSPSVEAIPTSDTPSRPTPVVPETTSTPTTLPRPSTTTVSFGPDILLGIGLAGAISTALITARHRARRRYQPGSGQRDDLTVAPIVSRLHRASRKIDTSRVNTTELPVGVRDGQTIALTLAATRGLGLVGDGAISAARALLITQLAHNHTPVADSTFPARVIIPASDLPKLLEQPISAGDLPASVQITATLDEALDELETLILHRARLHTEPHHADPPLPTVALVATPPSTNNRLQAILDNGSSLGIAGLLLGQWQTGTTVYVRSDGTVSTTNSGSHKDLTGTRLFHLPSPPARDLLSLLRSAYHDSEPEKPADTQDTARLESTTTIPKQPIDNQRETVNELFLLPEKNFTDMPVRITILGPVRLSWRPSPPQRKHDRDITAAFTARAQELLIYLALHPNGIRRDTVIETLWPDTHQQRPTNALNSTLTRLHRAISAATDGTITKIAIQQHGHYHLDPTIVDVDYWHYHNALTTYRHRRYDDGEVNACRAILDHYQGNLAEGLDVDWIEPLRESARRDALDTVAAFSRLTIEHHPQETLRILDTARAWDPYNEGIYRDLMRVHVRLGHTDAAGRTLALLTRQLSDIGEQPSAGTRELAAQLRSQDEHLTA